MQAVGAENGNPRTGTTPVCFAPLAVVRTSRPNGSYSSVGAESFVSMSCVSAAPLQLVEALDRIAETVIDFEDLLIGFLGRRKVLHFLVQLAGSVIQVLIKVWLVVEFD